MDTDLIDIGWGALSGGVPANTVLGIRIKRDGGNQGLGNKPVRLENMNLFRIQTPSKWTWKIQVFEGNYPDSDLWGNSVPSYMTALKAFAKFIQAEPKWLRVYTYWFQTLHSTNWVQVMGTPDTYSWERALNRYPIAFDLEEVLPIDMNLT